MRIKKTSNTRAIAGKVLNVNSGSTTDTYSCDYINDCNTYSTSEVNTGKTWIDGKPIYRVVTEFTTPSTSSWLNVSTNITNLDTIVNMYSIAIIDVTFYNIPMDGSEPLILAYRKDLNKIICKPTNSTFFSISIKTIIEYTKSS